MQWCVLLVYISLIGTSVITSACSQQFRSGYKRFLETVRLKDPFGVIWNIETQECKPHYDIDVDVRRYGIIENKIGDGWIGDQIALIYAPGLWPSIAANGTDINGGVPQVGSAKFHPGHLECLPLVNHDCIFSHSSNLAWCKWLISTIDIR